MSHHQRFPENIEIKNKLCKQESIILDQSKEIEEIKQVCQRQENVITELTQQVKENFVYSTNL